MSPIGRIFIVINLVLAVAFLGWASAALSKSQDFKKDLADAKAQHEKDIAAVQAELDQTVRDRDAARTGKQEAETRETQLKGQAETLQATADRQKDSLSALSTAVESMQGELEGYKTTNDDLTERLSETADSLSEAKDERDELRGERDGLQTDKDGLERDLTEANNTIAALEREREELRGEISQQATLIATAQEIFETDFAQLMAMPHINAAVQLVTNDVQPGLVSLSVGRAHGVQRGFTFEIFNGGTYKGRVRVINVQEDQCSAVIEKTYEGRTIAQGDSAATHI